MQRLLDGRRDQAIASKFLATIVTDVPIVLDLDRASRTAYDRECVFKLFTELEFFSLLNELGPAEDARQRDYQTLASAPALDAFLASIPSGAPVAVSIGALAPDLFAAQD